MCAAHGISHSHFLGGPQVWTVEDRDKAIWWQHRKACTCGSCGTRPEEWDPKLGGHRQAYAVSEQICGGCEVLQRAQDQQGQDTPLRGAQLVLVRRKDT